MTPASLKSWRHELRLSQRAAAEALGVSERQFRYYEAGEYPIPRTVALACAALAHGLGE